LQASPKIYDSQGRLLPLGRRIGRGGEGEVYESASNPGLVVKLYHKPILPERAEKIRAMVQLRAESLIQVAAWPVETCHRQPGAGVSGLVMPKVTGHEEIHNLYSPKSRLRSFPEAHWKFLVHASANLARAFAVVHEHGHLVGDVNHGNVLVSSQATVRLIDCDSFQVQAGNRLFVCEVGVSTHVPPELQGGSLRVPRTENHDAFGLAVLIFQILFMGRHPYSGQFLGSGDMPIEKAIREHRFAYGSMATSRQMRQPPNTLALAAASPPVAALFERAFSHQAAEGNLRPRARDWVAALESIETVTCGRNSAHLYLKGLPSCPWCPLEARAGTVFFYCPPAHVAGTGFDIVAVWAQISAIPSPGPLPGVPEPQAYPAQPSANVLHAVRGKSVRQILAVVAVSTGVAFGIYLGGCAAFGVIAVALAVATGIANTKAGPEYQAARQRLKDSQEHLKQLRDTWHQHARDELFQKKVADLQGLRKEHQGLPALRFQKLAALEADRRNSQMERYLDRYRIDRAKISGIGPGRAATLQSYGIETARDVKKWDILKIPGFGPVLTGTLLGWRWSLESKFVFDSSRGVDPADIATLDRSLAARRSQIEQALLAGAAELEKIRFQITSHRQSLLQQLEAAARVVAQSEADVRVF
jgi:DNA-binding helix-hairpin-helix protein with protein kinase domain